MSKWGRRGATKYEKFRGKAVYVKPYVPDEYNGKEEWKCGMTVTKEMFDRIRDTGCQLKKKLAEGVPNIDENTPYVVFRRPVEKSFSNGDVEFCPPIIYDADNEALVSYVDSDGELVRQYPKDSDQPERKGEMLLIGNGSDIEVTVAIFPAGSYGKGHRLESIRIIDLIEYKPSDKDEKKEDEADNSNPLPPETKKSAVGW